MKKVYESPRVVTEAIVLGVFGCYGKTTTPVKKPHKGSNHFPFFHF